MMGDINGFSWNCGGLRRSTPSTLFKVMFFEKSFSKFDFFFFLETHHKDDNDLPSELGRYRDAYHIVHSPCDLSDTHTGIIGLISKKYDISDVEHLMQGRMLGLRMTDPSTRVAYRISAVYLPTNQNLGVDVVRQIVRKLRVPDDHENYIILGDFNFKNIETASPLFGVVFFLSYIFFVFFVLLVSFFEKHKNKLL